MGYGTDFFATGLDLDEGISGVETTLKLKYVRLHSQTESVFDIYTTAFDIPNLGIEESTSILKT